MSDLLKPEGLFNRVVESDFFQLICGEMIGKGSFRQVWSCLIDPSVVIKIENGAGSFSNIHEWDVWCDAEDRGDEIRKWFAPCVSISPCGSVLVQKRTRPARKYPDMIPAFMADTKRQNFGMYGRNFVAHDYGNHRLYNSGFTKRMKKADWWDG